MWNIRYVILELPILSLREIHSKHKFCIYCCTQRDAKVYQREGISFHLHRPLEKIFKTNLEWLFIHCFLMYNFSLFFGVQFTFAEYRGNKCVISKTFIFQNTAAIKWWESVKVGLVRFSFLIAWEMSLYENEFFIRRYRLSFTNILLCHIFSRFTS